MTTHYNRIAAGDVGRIAALSDGIFAFAATVLVIDIHKPDVAAIPGEGDLPWTPKRRDAEAEIPSQIFDLQEGAPPRMCVDSENNADISGSEGYLRATATRHEAAQSLRNDQDHTQFEFGSHCRWRDDSIDRAFAERGSIFWTAPLV